MIQKINLNGRLMFASGDIELLNGACVSVAGSRQIDGVAAEWLKDIVAQCHCPVVSGLALGADAVAHRAALDNGIPTIAVLPSGLRNIAPRQHGGLARRIVKSGGLVLSEYEPKAGPCRDSYIARNQIIAELGKMLIMPQCERQSGTMHTVRFTRNLNKFIVLPDLDYSGNQYLIHDSGFKTIIK